LSFNYYDYTSPDYTSLKLFKKAILIRDFDYGTYMRYVVLSLLLCSAFESLPQTLFNKRMDIGFEALAFTSIVASDSCYYMTGIAADSVYPYRIGSIFGICNLDGSIRSVKSYFNFPNKSLETWRPVLTLDNNMLCTFGQLDLPQDRIVPIFVAYNLAGDTLIFQEYASVTGDTLWSTGTDFIRYNENFNYLLVTDYINYNNRYNFSLIKTDNLGEKVWHKLPFIHPPSVEVKPSSIIKDKDGTILVLGRYGNVDIVPKNFTSRDLLVRLDTSGSVVETWLSPESRLQGSTLSDLIQTQDEGYAFTSGIGKEIGDILDPYHLLWYNAGICKLNNNLEEEWFIHFGEPETAGYDTFLRNLIELNDGSIVATGNYREMLSEPVEIEGYDDQDYYNINGWILKVSASGDSLWSRQYHFVVSPQDEHWIYDFKVTSDSGFILCGDAVDYLNKIPPPMQGWIIKTDEYGCIVSGCNTGLQEVQENSPLIKIYPNPVNDYLNIYICNKDKKDLLDAKGRLINISGKVITEFRMWQSDLTYILPVYNYPAGVYVFQYLQKSCVKISERILIIR